MNFESKLNDHVEWLLEQNIDASNGLNEKLFYLVSSLTPIPNVDLWIENEIGQILLSWRDDVFYGKGWHFPGGCIRFYETLEQRIQKTSLSEIGCEVTFEESPLAVRDAIRGKNTSLSNENVRGHNITILYKCFLPLNYMIDNQSKKIGDEGYLKWFSEIPDDLLEIHASYKDIIKKWEESGVNKND